MKLGVVGVGEIATAVVQSLCTSGMTDLVINLSPRNERNSRELAGRFDQVHRLQSNQRVLDQSDVILLSVRPDDSKAVLRGLEFRPDHQVISLVTFLTLSQLADAVGPASTISRAVPLPAVVTHRCPIPICNANETVVRIFGHMGQPLPVEDESQLHVLWALTGLIAPFYELLGELSGWAADNGVQPATANQYVADLFGALSLMARKTRPLDFGELVKRATTPNGMNEQAGREIRQQRAHEIYRAAVERLLERLK